MCQTWRIYLPFLLLILPTLTAQNPVLPLNPREASLNKSGWRPAKLVEPVPPSVSGKEFGLLRKRQSDKLGSWSLRALTCPAGLTECDSRPKAANGCCPEDMFCVSYAFKRTCCPSEERCDEVATSFPLCADPSWSLWESEEDKYFCCLPGEKGFLNTNGGGACGTADMQLKDDQVATSAVPYGGSGQGSQDPTNSILDPSKTNDASSSDTTETGASTQTTSSSDGSSDSANSSNGASGGGGGLAKGTLIGIIVGAIGGLIAIALIIFFSVKYGVKQGRISVEKDLQRQQGPQSTTLTPHLSNPYLALTFPRSPQEPTQQSPQDVKYGYTGVVQNQSSEPYQPPQHGHHEVDGAGRQWNAAEMDGQNRR